MPQVKRDYDRIFRLNPVVANLFLLLCELEESDSCLINGDPEELYELMKVRFRDQRDYQWKKT